MSWRRRGDEAEDRAVDEPQASPDVEPALEPKAEPPLPEPGGDESGATAPPLEVGDAFAAAVLRAREEGVEEGRRLERQEQDNFEQLSAQILQRLASSVDRVAALNAALLEEARRQVLDLAVTLAHRLVGEELSVSPERVLGMTQEILSGLGPTTALRLRMHPQDLAIVETHRDQVIAASPGLVDLELLPDPSLERGGCVIEQGRSIIDAKLHTRLHGLRDRIDADSSPTAEAP